MTVRPPEQRTREFQRKFMELEYVRYTTLMKKIGIKPE